MTKADDIHGAIVHPDTGRKDSLIRVAVKAVILDDEGRTLVVKEDGRDWWDVPGGGMEHGETVKEALARELYEEISLEGDFEYEILIAEDPRLIKTVNMYQMRITFLVKPSSMTFKPGIDGDEIQFIDADIYETSELWTERQICMLSQLAKKRKSASL